MNKFTEKQIEALRREFSKFAEMPEASREELSGLLVRLPDVPLLQLAFEQIPFVSDAAVAVAQSRYPEVVGL